MTLNIPLSSIADVLHVGPDEFVELLGLGGLLAEFGGQAGHLFLERLTVVLHLGCTDIAARRQDVIVMADIIEHGALAEAGDVFVPLTLALSRKGRGSKLVSPPGVIGIGDPENVFLGQFAMDAIDHGAQLPGIDEERLAAPVAEAPILFFTGDKPEANGDLCGVEELAGQCNHAVNQVGLDDVLADFTLPGLVGGHRTVGEDEACQAGRGEMMDEVLNPGEVGVGGWWNAVFPSFIVL